MAPPRASEETPLIVGDEAQAERVPLYKRRSVIAGVACGLLLLAGVVAAAVYEPEDDIPEGWEVDPDWKQKESMLEVTKLCPRAQKSWQWKIFDMKEIAINEIRFMNNKGKWIKPHDKSVNLFFSSGNIDWVNRENAYDGKSWTITHGINDSGHGYFQWQFKKRVRLCAFDFFMKPANTKAGKMPENWQFRAWTHDEHGMDLPGGNGIVQEVTNFDGGATKGKKWVGVPFQFMSPGETRDRKHPLLPSDLKSLNTSPPPSPPPPSPPPSPPPPPAAGTVVPPSCTTFAVQSAANPHYCWHPDGGEFDHNGAKVQAWGDCWAGDRIQFNALKTGDGYTFQSRKHTWACLHPEAGHYNGNGVKIHAWNDCGAGRRIELNFLQGDAPDTYILQSTENPQYCLHPDGGHYNHNGVKVQGWDSCPTDARIAVKLLCA